MKKRLATYMLFVLGFMFMYIKAFSTEKINFNRRSASYIVKTTALKSGNSTQINILDDVTFDDSDVNHKNFLAKYIIFSLSKNFKPVSMSKSLKEFNPGFSLSSRLFQKKIRLNSVSRI